VGNIQIINELAYGHGKGLTFVLMLLCKSAYLLFEFIQCVRIDLRGSDTLLQSSKSPFELLNFTLKRSSYQLRILGTGAHCIQGSLPHLHLPPKLTHLLGLIETQCIDIVIEKTQIYATLDNSKHDTWESVGNKGGEGYILKREINS